MTRDLQLIITLLEKVARNWPDEYHIQANGGNFLLVNTNTLEIIKYFEIPCDGGDANIVERNGKEYLDL